MSLFQLVAPFQPAGDQPQAIEQLVAGLRDGQAASDAARRHRLGQDVHDGQRHRPAAASPTLVLSHNKTLAAQLYSEFKEFFPHNAVHYFVSYYDYYQPEAYIPQRDIYIEKDASINEEIDRLRLAATSALVSREDVIVVASVSCIYGLGSPDDYRDDDGPPARSARSVDRDETAPEARRHPVRPQRHRLRARQVPRPRRRASRSGRRTRSSPSASSSAATRSRRSPIINPLSGEVARDEAGAVHLSGQALRHCPRSGSRRRSRRSSRSWTSGWNSSRSRASCWRPSGSAPARGTTSRCCWRSATARASRTTAGPLAAASRASRPYTLLDFFPDDFLLFVDESHVTVPQVRGMFAGDRSRKITLVEHGFRLPSALDNRPLRFDEWEKKLGQRALRLGHAGPLRAGRVRRRSRRAGHPPDRPGRSGHRSRAGPRPGAAPAGARSSKRAAEGERVLVTTLTKRLAEDLSQLLHASRACAASGCTASSTPSSA